jgi:two-component system cell cycle sensor histidine kinase/response regulator CckA
MAFAGIDQRGMTEETRRRLFEPFFTTRDRGKGTGLGLATVFGIVEQNGGHVYVYSEPGQGATFKIYLPRTTGTQTKDASLDLPVRAGSETVLLVEDEQAVRMLVKAILENAGYRVRDAENPVERRNCAQRWHHGDRCADYRRARASDERPHGVPPASFLPS